MRQASLRRLRLVSQTAFFVLFVLLLVRTEFTPPLHGTAAADQPTGDASSGQVPEIGGKERNPEREQGIFRIVAFGDEQERKPIRDEEPDRVGLGGEEPLVARAERRQAMKRSFVQFAAILKKEHAMRNWSLSSKSWKSYA